MWKLWCTEMLSYLIDPSLSVFLSDSFGFHQSERINEVFRLLG